MTNKFAQSLLVPVDFTERSLHALNYASEIAKKHDGMVHLLHILDERTDPDQNTIETARKKLTDFAHQQQDRLDINIIPNVVKGNIFISIGETAKKVGAQLIIMGIHGIHGIQFIIGSFAARVILGSSVPVLLTNGSKKFDGFKNIVLPFDANLKMDHLVSKTIELGLINNSTIHLFSQNKKQGFLTSWEYKKKINTTLERIKKAELKCQNIVLEGDSDDYDLSILKYAENIDADLIMVTSQNQHNSKEYIIMETGISLMDKSKTPLFFLNPEN